MIKTIKVTWDRTAVRIANWLQGKVNSHIAGTDPKEV